MGVCALFPSPCGDYGSYLRTLHGLYLKEKSFRPLAGIMVLIIGLWLYESLCGLDTFPSPCGDYGSYLACSLVIVIVNYRFRPLAGIMVLIITTIIIDEVVNNISFRPLAGIMVLIAMKLCYSSEELQEFPSPCGDYGSYLKERPMLLERMLTRVSVPLRGLWFLSYEIDDLGTKMYEIGFRPLAGIMVLIKQENANGKLSILFPSPCGDYGSYPSQDAPGLRRSVQGVSVPLRGLWFLSAPFINAFMKPSKWHFAGRIIYFHHFLSFAGK